MGGADAARTQGEALGFQPARVFVEHPIQDRTDDEMRTIAEKAVDALVERLTVACGPAPRSRRPHITGRWASRASAILVLVVSIGRAGRRPGAAP